MFNLNTIIIRRCHHCKQGIDRLKGHSEKTFFPATVLILLLFIASISCAANNQAAPETGDSAYIAIIIDDLGYKLKQDQRALNLPGQVTFAILPHTPHVETLAETAHANGSDIMLHLPMQAVMDTLYLGPGALTKGMTEEEFKYSVMQSIRSIPHIKGVNNHMGSLITSQKDPMQWLMDEIAQTDLFFVDSRTTVKTLAQQTASQKQIKNTRRNVFLDHELNRPAIEFQFNHLIKLAKKNGSALAIGHPFNETLDVLEEKIPQLKAAGIQLISVSKLIEQQNLMHPYTQQRKAQPEKVQQKKVQNKTPLLTQNRLKRKTTSWHTSLSPLPKAVKN